ncbi:MAG: hypothetical protein ACLP07_05120 [Terracidiphilus sp.]
MKRANYAMLVCALLWLGMVVWLVASNVIAREIPPVGAIAQVLDRLPEAVRDPIFALMWLTFLLGWIAFLVLGTMPLFMRRSKNSK